MTLKNNDIKAEFTVTERAGLHRYSFPEGGANNLIINLGFAINWDKPYQTTLNVIDSLLVTGSRLSKGWAADQHVFFAVRFSQPISKFEITNVGGKGRTVGLLKFDEKQVMAKVGVSSVSIENALVNLDSSLPRWDFEATVQAASDAWEKELSKIKILSNDSVQKTIFYTLLYHTMVAPALFSDTNDEFKGTKGDVQKAAGYNRYTVFSLWDTYRALHPLFTLTQQPRVNDMVKSMLDHYRQTGFLPVWELEGNETFCMVGNHSIPVIAEAILKGIGDFDHELAADSDLLMLGLYDANTGEGYTLLGGFTRAQESAEVILPDNWLGQTVETFVFMVSSSGIGKLKSTEHFSPTMYAESITFEETPITGD